MRDSDDYILDPQHVLPPQASLRGEIPLNEQRVGATGYCSLTGVHNRHAFELHLQSLLYRDYGDDADPDHPPRHVLALFDIDQFRLINHRLGRGAGDDMLGAVADILADHVLGRGDMLARTGADEFGVIFEHQSLSRARTRCWAAMEAVSQHLFEWDERPVRLSLSAGLVTIADGDSGVSELISEADRLRRQATNEQRGSMRCLDAPAADTQPPRPTELSLAAELLTAVETGQLELHYQPIVPLRRSTDRADHSSAATTPRHYELLLRVRRGDQLVGPQPLLVAAEAHHLIDEVDRWVLSEAAGWLRDRPAWQVQRETCCVNLSARSICDRAFVDDACAMLRDLGSLAGSLCFELTETARIDRLDRARRAMERMIALGCSFALDDFGSGAASLPYLQQLPVKYLKIDGHFVRRAIVDGAASKLLDLINQIGHNAGKYTIAEHVEDAEALSLVESLGLDFAQGYHLGRPQPISTFRSASRPRHRGSAQIISLPLQR